MRLDEYAACDGLGLAALVREGEVTPGELVTLALEGIEAVDPDLGAVVEAYPDRVEAAAARQASTGPFDGVPVILKDLFHGEPGWSCGNGSRLTNGWVVQGEDEFTARMHRGGLIPMARSATSEFGLLGTTETIAHGQTCSPWSAERMAGGSSGGAGGGRGCRDRPDRWCQRRGRFHPDTGSSVRGGGAQAQPRAGPLGPRHERAPARLGRALRHDAHRA